MINSGDKSQTGISWQITGEIKIQSKKDNKQIELDGKTDRWENRRLTRLEVTP